MQRLLYYSLIWIIFYSSLKVITWQHAFACCNSMPLHTVSLKTKKKPKSLKYLWQKLVSECSHPSRRVKYADAFIFAPYSDTVWMKPGVHVQNIVSETLVKRIMHAGCVYLCVLNLTKKKKKKAKHAESSLLMGSAEKVRGVDVGALTTGTLWFCALWLLDTGGLKNGYLTMQALSYLIGGDLCSFSYFWGNCGLCCL